MYASRLQKRKATRARRPVKRVPRKRSGGRTAITKIVKSVLSRQAENKAWFDYGANQTITTAGLSTPANKNLIPLLSQGTGHSARVGNEVRVKSGYVRGHVNILPYNASTNPGSLPVCVKIWIVSDKKLNTNTLSSTTIGSNFFDIVNSSTSFQANMLDMDFTVNKDAWIVHATKQFKIGASDSTTTGAVTTFGYYDNSPMTMPFYFNIGKYMKTLKYDDATSTCTNKNMFIIFQAVLADGSTGAFTTSEFHYSIRVEYEDL